MSSSDIKDLLKSAREAVKCKDYAKTIIACKEILKVDKDHYMALVMMGAAYQETDYKEAARNLRHAASVTQDPTIALQGLCLCAEPQELPEIIKKLLKLNPAKYSDLHSKLVKAASICNKVVNEVTPFVELFSAESDSTGDRRSSALHCLAAIYISNAGCSANDAWQELFYSALEHSVNNTDQHPVVSHIDLYKAFLKLAHKLGKINDLVEKAQQMYIKFPTDVHSLEWICKIFVERSTNFRGGVTPQLQLPIEVFSEVSSCYALVARAIYWYQANDFVQSRDLLLKVNVSQVNWKCCQVWLARVYAKLGAFSLCEMLSQRLQIADLTLVHCLVEQNEKPKMETAIALCKQLLPSAEQDQQILLLIALAKAMIKKGDFIVAEKTIQKLIGLDQNEVANMLLAVSYRAQKLNEDSVKLLIDNQSDSCEYFLQLGQSQYAFNQPKAALENLRKAAKLEPHNSQCFYWLGRVYYDLNDHNLAMKCLERCCYLHPHHREAVILLSGIYRGVRNFTANNTILQNAAHPIPGFTSTAENWVGVLLGFHHLALNEFNEAIASFRVALRSDADDIASWEGLADAYLERGSLNSALRVYQKITELDSQNSYPKLQVANIKCKLRMHREAVESFTELLAEHPKLVPGLKGMAESHMGISNHCMSQRLLARSKYHASEAVKYLTSAISLRSDFAVLWRMMANALELIANLPVEHAHLEVPGSLAGVPNEVTTLAGDQLFELAARCFCRAIKISNDDVLLWYELALSYYMRASKYGENDNAKKYLELALKTVKHALKLMPSRWMNWNLMGVICSTAEVHQLALAQHCFIKALQLNKKSAVPWTNLGALYLQQGELKLANKVFGRAQQADTSFVNGWNGQAFIAEIMSEKDEAMDLFKHCTNLQYTPESALGFAHFVCILLSDPRAMMQSRYRYIIERMHAVPSALDSIEWYCKSEAVDASLESLCFLGYLYHQMRLWTNAIRAFRRAVDKATGVVKDKMLCNLGYCYLKNNEPDEALKVFHSVSEATFSYTIGLAYSHFKAKQFQESYTVYESALNLLASSDSDKAMILVAMSAMVYTFQGETDAKSLLFQCIGLPNPPVEGLFSGCALGILHNDLQLAHLVLQELQKYQHNPKYTHHIAFFTSQFQLKNNTRQKALAYLQSQVHYHPDNIQLRKVLTNFILLNFRGNEKLLTGASRIAESIILLQLTDLTCENSSMEGAKSLAMGSEAMRYVNQNIRKKLAQRAVHINPTCKEAWAALITCNQ